MAYPSTSYNSDPNGISCLSNVDSNSTNPPILYTSGTCRKNNDTFPLIGTRNVVCADYSTNVQWPGYSLNIPMIQKHGPDTFTAGYYCGYKRNGVYVGTWGGNHPNNNNNKQTISLSNPIIYKNQDTRVNASTVPKLNAF